MKKILSILSLIPLLTLSACQSVEEDPSVSDVNEEISADELVTYTNEEIGIAFEYPAEWGEIETSAEEGMTNEWWAENPGLEFDELPRDENDEVMWNATVNIIIRAKGLNISFANANSDASGFYGRGGGWYDVGMKFNNTDEADEYCENMECLQWINSNGIEVYEFAKLEGTFYEQPYSDVYEFGISNEDNTFSSILFSNINAVLLDVEMSGDELREVVDSLRFIQ